ncbi:MAG TPA: NADH-quinone oxidoreductase subunit M, partial [Opitutaceae bacterium]|nr:NADH-quinone oxidoreductase subunit M [Opitutaceae bacterium]
MIAPSVLTLVVFAPWIGAALVAVLPARYSRVTSLCLSLSTLALGMPLAACGPWAAGTAGLPLEEKLAWIPALRIDYHLGVDGMSVVLVLLTGVVGPMSLLASWSVERDGRLFRALLL